MSKKMSKKMLAVRKAAVDTVRKFDEKHDTQGDSPVPSWALAEALGIHATMTACREHQGHAISTLIAALLKGADLGMELKDEMLAEMQAERPTAH
jgi:hypothetical protein